MTPIDHRDRPAARLDFLVIGAQKCATTRLHDCLGEHPELALPKHKLEMAYLGGNLVQERGVDWYFGQVPAAPEARARGHVSVEYLADPRSPAAVHQHLPDVRFVVSLHDPVDRAVSAYHWYLRKAMVPSQPVDTGLRQAVTALGGGDPTHAPLRDVLERGFYAEQLERYLPHFTVDRFLFLDYHDIAHAPERVLAQVFAFFGVDPAFRPPSIGTKPLFDSYVGALTRLQRLMPNTRQAGKALDLAHQALHRLGARSASPRLDAGLEHELAELYAPRRERLRELIATAPAEQQPMSFRDGVGWFGAPTAATREAR